LDGLNRLAETAAGVLAKLTPRSASQSNPAQPQPLPPSRTGQKMYKLFWAQKYIFQSKIEIVSKF